MTLTKEQRDELRNDCGAEIITTDAIDRVFCALPALLDDLDEAEKLAKQAHFDSVAEHSENTDLRALRESDATEIADLRRQLAATQPVVEAAEAFVVTASTNPMLSVGANLCDSIHAYVAARDAAKGE